MPSHYDLPSGSLFANPNVEGLDRIRAREAEGRRQGILSLQDVLLGELNQPRNQGPAPNPFESLTFQSGLGSLKALLDTQRRADESSAAARGVQGGEAASASGASRLSALVTGTRGLAAQAGEQANRDRRFRAGEKARRRALMLQLLGIQINQDQFQQQIDEQRRGNTLGFLGDIGGVLGGGLGFLLGGPPGAVAGASAGSTVGSGFHR